MIGVLVGLFGVALIVLALWFYFRRRQQRIIEKEPGPSEADGTERLTMMYGGGPVSPVAGPTSVSTGQETSAGARTMHTASASISTSNQGTVESGGGPLHEMHGKFLFSFLFLLFSFSFLFLFFFFFFFLLQDFQN